MCFLGLLFLGYCYVEELSQDTPQISTVSLGCDILLVSGYYRKVDLI